MLLSPLRKKRKGSGGALSKVKSRQVFSSMRSAAAASPDFIGGCSRSGDRHSAATMLTGHR